MAAKSPPRKRAATPDPLARLERGLAGLEGAVTRDLGALREALTAPEEAEGTGLPVRALRSLSDVKGRLERVSRDFSDLKEAVARMALAQERQSREIGDAEEAIERQTKVIGELKAALGDLRVLVERQARELGAGQERVLRELSELRGASPAR